MPKPAWQHALGGMWCMGELGSAVWISLQTSLVATMLCVVAGIPAACLIVMRPLPGKRLLIAALNTMLSLPTVVIGLLGYLLLCRRSFFGSLGLLYTPAAIVVGQFILALPIMTVFSHSAIAAIDPAARETARMLGAGEARIARMLISEARFGIMAAVAATFGRLVGEVGIAMMLGGNIAGYTRTMTTAIALEASKGEVLMGLRLGGILMATAVAVNLLLRFLQGRTAT